LHVADFASDHSNRRQNVSTKNLPVAFLLAGRINQPFTLFHAHVIADGAARAGAAYAEK
jgi:hypothetical protein